MTASSFGPKKQPRFAAGDAPDLSGNPTEVADYAASFGNYMTGTTAERNTATSWAWEGLEFWDTTLKVKFVFTGGAWIQSGYGPWITASLAGGITVAPGRTPVKYRSTPGGVQLQGCVNGSSGSGYNLFNLPEQFRPPVEVQLWASAGGYVQVLPSGAVNSTIAGAKTAVSFQGSFER